MLSHSKIMSTSRHSTTDDETTTCGEVSALLPQRHELELHHRDCRHRQSMVVLGSDDTFTVHTIEDDVIIRPKSSVFMNAINSNINVAALLYKKGVQNVANGQKPQDVDESEVSMVRHRPESLLKLCQETRFTKKELQLMYRGFKQGCPNGIVTLEQFKAIYAQFFPYGMSDNYAQLVFNTFDVDSNGSINFEEFAVGLSIISRGSERDKLEWIFTLYDVGGDGRIDRSTMTLVVNSMYELVGGRCVDQYTGEHVDEVFREMDTDNDGYISREEFIEGCQHSGRVTEALHLFDTKF